MLPVDPSVPSPAESAPPVPPTLLEVATALTSILPALDIPLFERVDPFTGIPRFRDENEDAEAVLAGFETLLSTEEGQDQFLTDIFSKGQNTDTEFILDLLGFTQPQIDDFFTGAPLGQGSALEATIRRIFPDRDLDAVLAQATSENEDVQAAFWEEIRNIGVTADTWALLEMAYPDLTTLERTEFFIAHPEPSSSFLSAIGDRLSGAFQYTDGWWQAGLMELGFAFEDAGAPLRWLLGREAQETSVAERLMNKAFKEHGWKAIFSGDVADAWDVYFFERDVRGPAKFVAEMANPLYFIPIGGSAFALARPFLRVPVLGATMQNLARGVQAAELLPFKAVTAGVRAPFTAGRFTSQLLAKRVPGGVRGGAGAATGRFLLRELPTPAQLATWMFPDDAFKAIAQRIPLLGKLAPSTQIGTLPLQLATEKELTQAVTQVTLQRQVILDIGAGQKAQAVAALRELGTTKQIYGINDLAIADARLVRARNALDSLALGDIVQAPERYIFSHPNGLLYAKRAQALTEDMFQLAVKEGVDVKRVGLEPFQEFVHWVTTGRVDADGLLVTKRTGNRSVGGIVQSMRHRRFTNQIEGIQAGFRYSTNLEAYVATYTDDMFKAIADKRMGEGLAEVVARAEALLPVDPLGRLQALYPGVERLWTGVRKQMDDLRYTLRHVQGARRGEVLSGSTMAAIRRRNPANARLLDEAYSLGEKTFDKELARFSDEVWEQIGTTPREFKNTILALRGAPTKRVVTPKPLTEVEFERLRFLRDQDVPSRELAALEVRVLGVPSEAAAPLLNIRAGEIDTALRFINADGRTSIRMLKQIYKNTHAQRGALLKDLSTDLTQQVTDLSPRWFQARSSRADKFAEVSRPRLGKHEGQILTARGLPHPMFQNQIYPEAISEQVTRLLNNEANAFLKVGAGISSPLVLLEAAIDVSAGMIQGLIAHFAHPRQAFNATVRMVDAFIKPGAFDRYIARRSATMNDRIFHLGSTAPADFFESMGFVTKLAGKIPGGEWVVGQTYGRGQAAFSMWSTVYKDLMWDIGSTTWKKGGKGADFAKYLDRSVGQASFAQLGTPANVTALLRGWVSFAPQYRVAVSSFLASAFKGGMTGAQVRRDLAKAIAGSVIMYTAWAEATGNQVYLDPFRDGKKFMSIKIGEHWYGPGSAVISLLRMSADIAASAFSIGENEPMDFLSFDKWENPIIRGWMTQAAPLPSILIEAATQKDFLGYPLDTVADWAGWAASKVTPIMSQDVVYDRSGVPETPMSLLANTFGWRTSPTTRWERFDATLRKLNAWQAVDDLTEEQTAALESGDSSVLSILNRFQKVKMLNAFQDSNPEVAEMYADAVRDALLRSGAAFQNYTASIENVKNEARDNLSAAVDVGVNLDDKSTLWLRNRYGDIMNVYGAKNESLREAPEYQELFAEWEESKEKRLPDAEMFDLAYWDYIENVVAPDRLLPNGDFDFEGYNTALDVFEQDYGREVHDMVRLVLEENKVEAGFPEWSIRLWKDRASLGDAGYWELPTKPLKQFTQSDLDAGVVPEEFILTVQRLIRLERESRIEGNEASKVELARLLEDEALSFDRRTELRKTNPELDAILGLWHYGGKVQTQAGVDLMDKWGEELDIPFSAMGGGLPPRDLVPFHLEYSALESGVARLRYRDLHPAWNDFLVEVEGLSPIGDRVSRLLPERLDEIDVQYNKLPTEGDARAKFLLAHNDYRWERRRIDGLERHVPTARLEDHIAFYELPETGFSRDRFLRDNSAYYNNVWLNSAALDNKAVDFERIPAVAFEDAFDEKYTPLSRIDRLWYRWNNRAFDKEGARLGFWKPITFPGGTGGSGGASFFRP